MKTNNELKELRCKELLDHLMRNGVGYENRRSAKDIINWFNSDTCVKQELLGLFNTRQDIEATILELREKCNRKIGSSTSGYWMMCSKDEKDGYSYLKNQALAKMKTAIRCGVDPKVFYAVLNEIKPECNKVADGQITLEEKETKRVSDDLYKIKEEIFGINLADRLTYEERERVDFLLKDMTNLIEREKGELSKYGI